MIETNDRRFNQLRQVPLERRISELMVEIEKCGASVELTNCVIALSKALVHLANHVDSLLVVKNTYIMNSGAMVALGIKNDIAEFPEKYLQPTK